MQSLGLSPIHDEEINNNCFSNKTQAYIHSNFKVNLISPAKEAMPKGPCVVTQHVSPYVFVILEAQRTPVEGH